MEINTGFMVHTYILSTQEAEAGGCIAQSYLKKKVEKKIVWL